MAAGKTVVKSFPFSEAERVARAAAQALGIEESHVKPRRFTQTTGRGQFNFLAAYKGHRLIITQHTCGGSAYEGVLSVFNSRKRKPEVIIPFRALLLAEGIQFI